MPSTATALDVCNLALFFCGEDKKLTSVLPSDGTERGDECDRLFPMAFDEMLTGEYSWSFATKRVALSLSASPSFNWRYAYSVPADCQKIISVIPNVAVSRCESAEFETFVDAVGDQIIYTDVEDASLLYVYALRDTTRCSPKFITALAYRLASYLLGGINKTAATEQKGTQLLAKSIEFEAQGIAVDMNQQNIKVDYKAKWTPPFPPFECWE